MEDVEALAAVLEELLLDLGLRARHLQGEEPTVEHLLLEHDGLLLAAFGRYVRKRTPFVKHRVAPDSLELAGPGKTERLNDGLHDDEAVAEAVLDHDQGLFVERDVVDKLLIHLIFLLLLGSKKPLVGARSSPKEPA